MGSRRGQRSRQLADEKSLLRFLQAFVGADSWAASQHVIVVHPELLTEAADQLLTGLAASQENDEARQVMEMHRALMRRCREVGIEAAFDELDTDVPKALREAVREAQAAMERESAADQPAALDAVVAAWGALTRHEAFATASLAFRAAVFDMWGRALKQRYTARRDSGDLTAAITAWRQALDNTPTDAPERPVLLNDLGVSLGQRYGTSGVSADRETAIEAFQEALKAAPLDAPGRPDYFSNLGLALRDRYDQSGELADLEAAITGSEQAVRTAPPDAEGRAAYLSNLGGALRARYNHGGVVADLDAAITAYQEAVDTSSANPDATYLSNLANGLSDRYERSGVATDLDAAISAWELSVEATPAGSPDRTDAIGKLGIGLRARYARKGALADLDGAIDAYQEAVEAIAADAPDRPQYLDRLGNALFDRYVRRGSPTDLEAAIKAFQQAVDTTRATAPERGLYLGGLGGGLRERYHLRAVQADLDAAITALRQAVEATPINAPYQRALANALGVGLLDRFARGAAPADLEAAITAFGQAIDATAPDAPDRAGYLGNFALALRERYDLSGALADRDAATGAYRQACRLGLTIAPAVTLTSAQAWGAWASEREGWAEAAEAYRDGLDAIDGLYRTQILPGAKQTWLGDAQGLAAAAAYALARTGDLRGAFLALERGRARLLTEAVERDRADLAEVATLDPAAYAAYGQAARQLRSLESQERATGIGRPSESPSVPIDVLQEQARQTRADLETAIERIQQLPGHASFGRPPSFDEIAAVVEPGCPMVALVTTAAGSVALLVARVDGSAAPTFEAMWAPELTTTVLTDLLTTVEDGQVVGGYLAGQLGEPDWLEAALADGLPEVGASLVGPVAARLRELNATGVVLLPTGLLGLLPLHAAPYVVDGETRCLLDEFDVSHTPGARVLGAARAALAAREVAPPVLVGVGNPQPHPQPLAFARAELEEVARFFPDGASHTLYETAATETALVGLLPQATHVHLACHGRFDADNPLDSCLELARPDASEPAGDEGRVRLEEILANDWFDHSWLVVLSACQTAITDARRLPDEAIGLPAGLLQAGVPGVIGTLWSVDDLSTTLLMTQFYAYHRRGDPLTGEGPLSPAAALRRAQGWLRTRTADDLVTLLAAHRSMAAAAEQRHGTRMSAAEAGAGLRQLGLEDPTSRPFAAPYYWAPFVAIGA